jgi:signal transduction histidine kinase
VHRRILFVALTAVTLALILLGAPLAIAARELLIQDERGELASAAIEVAVRVPQEMGADDQISLDQGPGIIHLAVYDGNGARMAGVGPTRPDWVTRTALQGDPTTGFDEDDLIAAVPVLNDQNVVAVVRAASSRRSLTEHQLLAFLALFGAAAVALAAAMVLALWLARRLSVPLDELREAAEELGDGNFAVRAPASGIKELDGVAASLNVTAHRLGQLVDRERAFSAHASHQLRTPLTALRLRLDQAIRGDRSELETAAHESMTIVDDLETTVEDLLAISRGRSAAVEPLDLDRLLEGLPGRWEGLLAADGRTLVIRQDDPPVAAAREATVRQVLDVLIDNAYRHGGGSVRVIAREASGALAIDVVDDGRPGVSSADVDAEFTRASIDSRPRGAAIAQAPPRRDATRGTRTAVRRGGTGIGLALAGSLLAADGGRLLLSSVPGRTTATVLLPASDTTA